MLECLLEVVDDMVKSQRVTPGGLPLREVEEWTKLSWVDLPGIEPGPPPCHGGVMPIYYRPFLVSPPGVEPGFIP